MLIVDNSILAFSNQLENGIYVPSFMGDRADAVLNSLIPVLKSLANAENIRTKLNGITGIKSLYEGYLREQRKKN